MKNFFKGSFGLLKTEVNSSTKLINKSLGSFYSTDKSSELLDLLDEYEKSSGKSCIKKFITYAQKYGTEGFTKDQLDGLVHSTIKYSSCNEFDSLLKILDPKYKLYSGGKNILSMIIYSKSNHLIKVLDASGLLDKQLKEHNLDGTNPLYTALLYGNIKAIKEISKYTNIPPHFLPNYVDIKHFAQQMYPGSDGSFLDVLYVQHEKMDIQEFIIEEITSTGDTSLESDED